MDLDKIKTLVLLQNTNSKFVLEKSIETLINIFDKIDDTKEFDTGEDLKAEGYRLDVTLDDIKHIIVDYFKCIEKLLK